MARLSELRPVSLDITVSSDTYNYLEYVSHRQSYLSV